MSGVIYLLIPISNSRAEIAEQFYNPLKDIKSMSFIMSSPAIVNLLVTKKKMTNASGLKAYIEWSANREELSVELKTSAKLDSITQGLVIEMFRNKASLVIGNNFDTWIKGYKASEKKGQQIVYTDPSGLLDKSEITMTKSRTKLIVAEKKPIGSIRTSYELMYPKWSADKAVIKEVSRVAFEGARILRVKTQIKYKKIILNKYFPVKITSQSTHGVSFDSSHSIERNLDSTFEITSYKIKL